MVKLVKIEALRGIAALYVLLHHFNIGEGSWLKYFTQQGQLAVILFFLVSGFVLHVSNHQAIHDRKLGFGRYFIKRFRRIYPVLLASMVISYIALCLSKMELADFNWPEFFANVLNVQDLARHPGYWYEAFGQNTPLWSLSYEWWFYMMFFPIARYLPMDKQRYLVLVLSLVGFSTYWLFPNQASMILEYFIIWWIGVELGKAWQEGKLLTPLTLSFVFGSLVGLLTLQVFRAFLYEPTMYPAFNPAVYPDYGGPRDPSFYPVVNVLHTCYALFILGCGFIWYKMGLRGFEKTIGFFAFFSPISYSIYVFHYPMVMRYKFSFFPSIAVQYAVCLIALFTICYLVEVKLQRSVNRVLR